MLSDVHVVVSAIRVHVVWHTRFAVSHMHSASLSHGPCAVYRFGHVYLHACEVELHSQPVVDVHSPLLLITGHFLMHEFNVVASQLHIPSPLHCDVDDCCAHVARHDPFVTSHMHALSASQVDWLK
jgi:hypothetical protein